MQRIKHMLTDSRTWSTLLYMLMMLPLGVAYFSVAVTGLATSLALIASPFAALYVDNVKFDISFGGLPQALAVPLAMIAGVLLLFGTMHLARGVGRVHGQLAKNLLVRSAQY